MKIVFCKWEFGRSLEWGYSINNSNQLMGRKQVRAEIRKVPKGTLFECCGRSLSVFEASMSTRSKTATRVRHNAPNLTTVVELGAEKQYFKGFFLEFQKYAKEVDSILTTNKAAAEEMSRMWGVKEWQRPLNYKRFRRGKLPVISDIARMVSMYKKRLTV